MSLSVGLGLLLLLATGLIIGLEITRETRNDDRGTGVRFFIIGALGGTVLMALVATFALFQSAIT